MNFNKQLKDGLIYQNPVLVQVLGMCSTMAITTSISNGVGMGISVLIILTLSNIFISLLRKIIPNEVRIACYIVVIAGFVTIVDLCLQAFFPDIAKSLGVFIPLIVVNCIVLGRAEAFASKNSVAASAVDGICQGIGYTVVLVIMCTVRELLGAGTLMGIQIMPASYTPALMLVLPVVSFAFFALLFNKGVARDIPIAVLDQDHTSLSRKVTQMIDDTATAMVSYGIQDMDEGERLMREGKIMAIVQIPAFFEKNILSNSQTHIETYISGTNITVNGLLSKDIQTAVTTFSGGVQIQLLTKQGLTELQAMAQLMPVRFNKHVLFNPYINYGYYLSPSFMPMMLLIFIVMVTVFTIGTELK